MKGPVPAPKAVGRVLPGDWEVTPHQGRPRSGGSQGLRTRRPTGVWTDTLKEPMFAPRPGLGDGHTQGPFTCSLDSRGCQSTQIKGKHNSRAQTQSAGTKEQRRHHSIFTALPQPCMALRGSSGGPESGGTWPALGLWTAAMGGSLGSRTANQQSYNVDRVPRLPQQTRWVLGSEPVKRGMGQACGWSQAAQGPASEGCRMPGHVAMTGPCPPSPGCTGLC